MECKFQPNMVWFCQPSEGGVNTESRLHFNNIFASCFFIRCFAVNLPSKINIENATWLTHIVGLARTRYRYTLLFFFFWFVLPTNGGGFAINFDGTRNSLVRKFRAWFWGGNTAAGDNAIWKWKMGFDFPPSRAKHVFKEISRKWPGWFFVWNAIVWRCVH